MNAMSNNDVPLLIQGRKKKPVNTRSTRADSRELIQYSRTTLGYPDTSRSYYRNFVCCYVKFFTGGGEA